MPISVVEYKPTTPTPPPLYVYLGCWDDKGDNRGFKDRQSVKEGPGAVEECYKAIGCAPISVRWVDINEGDVEAPTYRSRFVAREVNLHKREGLFAATPSPLSRH